RGCAARSRPTSSRRCTDLRVSTLAAPAALLDPLDGAHPIGLSGAESSSGLPDVAITFSRGTSSGDEMRSPGDARWIEHARLLRRLDAAAAAGRLIVFDARPGSGSRTAIRTWLARHPDWQVAWDDSRMPPDGADEVLRRGLRVLTHLPEVTEPGGRTVLVIENARRFADRLELLDLARLGGRRRDIAVVVCTAGQLSNREAQHDLEVVTDEDLAWDVDLAAEALGRRGLTLSEEQLAQLVQLCEGSAGRIIACAQLRTEYPGASAERMYARWLHERLSRHGADRLLLALDVLGQVPLELAPPLLAVADSSE